MTTIRPHSILSGTAESELRADCVVKSLLLLLVVIPEKPETDIIEVGATVEVGVIDWEVGRLE
jgi:hypothetical protein